MVPLSLGNGVPVSKKSSNSSGACQGRVGMNGGACQCRGWIGVPVSVVE